MEHYKGKSKCFCGRRARYRVRDEKQPTHVCEEHKDRLRGRETKPDSENYTEADYLTWLRL